MGNAKIFNRFRRIDRYFVNIVILKRDDIIKENQASPLKDPGGFCLFFFGAGLSPVFLGRSAPV